MLHFMINIRVRYNERVVCHDRWQWYGTVEATLTCGIIAEDGIMDLHRIGAVEEVQGATFCGAVTIERAKP